MHACESGGTHAYITCIYIQTSHANYDRCLQCIGIPYISHMLVEICKKGLVEHNNLYFGVYSMLVVTLLLTVYVLVSYYRTD